MLYLLPIRSTLAMFSLPGALEGFKDDLAGIPSADGAQAVLAKRSQAAKAEEGFEAGRAVKPVGYDFDGRFFGRHGRFPECDSLLPRTEGWPRCLRA